jgi:hypothetical protein
MKRKPVTKCICIVLSLMAAAIHWNSLSASTIVPPFQSHVLLFRDNQIALAPKHASLNLGESFTLEIWVYLVSALPYTSIMGKSHDPGNQDPIVSFALGLDSGQRMGFIQSTDQPGSYRIALAEDPFPLQTWTHVAATLGNGNMRLIINGQEVASANSAGPPNSPTVPFSIGSTAFANGTLSAPGFRGSLREARVWNRALSTSEILSNASKHMEGNEPGLVACWPLDDMTGTSARDCGSNHLDLQFGIPSGDSTSQPDWIALSQLDAAVNAFEVVSLPLQLPEWLTHAAALIIYDYDSDGFPDILIIQHDALTYPATNRFLGLLRNEGGTALQDVTLTAMGQVGMAHPANWTFADFNGDGRLDLAIADSGTETGPAPGGQSRILIQSPGGKLLDETPTRFPIMDAFTHDIASADIDGDGDIDIYLSNIAGEQNIGPRLYINNGTGHFTASADRLPPEIIDLTMKYTASKFLDVNRDGYPDLVLGGHGGSLPAEFYTHDSILLNDGQGRFTFADKSRLPPRHGGSSWQTVSIAVADFDRDNLPDLIMSTHEDYQEPFLQLLRNNGNGTFRDSSHGIAQAWPRSILGSSWVIRTDLADFNNDGWLDFLTLGAGVTPNALFINTGNCSFVDGSVFIPRKTPYAIHAVADFNHDGWSDIVQMDGASLFLFLNKGLHLRSIRRLRPRPRPRPRQEGKPPDDYRLGGNQRGD